MDKPFLMTSTIILPVAQSPSFPTFHLKSQEIDITQEMGYTNKQTIQEKFSKNLIIWSMMMVAS